MKKLFLSILSAILTFSILTFFTACVASTEEDNGENPPPEHVCVFDKVVVGDQYKSSDATCKKGTQYYYSCDCGKSGTMVFESGEKVGHNYEGGECVFCGLRLPSEGLDFMYQAYYKGYFITGMGACSDTEIVLPSTYNDIPVVGISKEAFRAKGYFADQITPKIESITIPDSIKTVEAKAFYNCFLLRKVNYLGTVKQWSEISFADVDANPLCYSEEWHLNGEKQEKIVIEGVEKISNYSFVGCPVKEVVLSDSVTSVGTGAFRRSKIENIEISSSVKVFDVEAFFVSDNLKKVNYLGTINQWSQIEFVRDYFYGADFSSNPVKNSKCLYLNGGLVESAVFEDINKINEGTFYNCEALKTISIPNSVQDIGDCAFYGCTNLNFNEKNGALYLGNDTNKYLYLKKSNGATTIDSSCRVIAEKAFSGQPLKEITIPNSVRRICVGAFSNCGLETVTIGSGVKHIGLHPFSGGTIKKINYLGSADQWVQIDFYEYGSSIFYDNTSSQFYINGVLAERIVLKNTKLINDYAFASCNTIKQIEIPDTVDYIGHGAFSLCKNLQHYGTTIKYLGNSKNNYLYLWEVTIKALDGILYIPEGCKFIAEIVGINHYKWNFSAVYLPSTLKSIGIRAFEYKNSIKELYFAGTEEQWKQVVLGQDWNKGIIPKYPVCNVKLGV